MSFEDIAEREAAANRTAAEACMAFYGVDRLPPPADEEELVVDEQGTPGASGGAAAEESAGGNRTRRSR